MRTALTATHFLHSDTGVVRSRNEDDLLALPEIGLWVVCDGMGGHDAGDYASHHIVSRLSQVPFPEHAGSQIRALERSLQESNAHLIDYTSSQGMDCVGSTVVALMLKDVRATVIWIGDSRAYRLRNQCIRMISRDHSVAEEQAEQGVAVNDELSSAITRAVGVMPEFDIDLMVSQSCAGDTWLLCSDGVSGSVEEHQMAQILMTSHDPARELVDQAIKQGSRDNCTAVVVRIAAV